MKLQTHMWKWQGVSKCEWVAFVKLNLNMCLVSMCAGKKSEFVLKKRKPLQEKLKKIQQITRIIIASVHHNSESSFWSSNAQKFSSTSDWGWVFQRPPDKQIETKNRTCYGWSSKVDSNARIAKENWIKSKLQRRSASVLRTHTHKRTKYNHPHVMAFNYSTNPVLDETQPHICAHVRKDQRLCLDWLFLSSPIIGKDLQGTWAEWSDGKKKKKKRKKNLSQVWLWKRMLAVITSQYQAHQCLRVIFIGLWCNRFLLCALGLINGVVTIRGWETEAKPIEIWTANFPNRAFYPQGHWIILQGYNADGGSQPNVHDKICGTTSHNLAIL